MYETREVAGHICNLVVSKTGIVREAAVRIGPADKPGFRAKDGPEAKRARREAKLAVMQALGLPPKKVRVVSRYSCLTVSETGLVARRDNDGNVIGVYSS